MFSYTEEDIVPNNVWVFGCGGTGSRLVPPLVQLLKSQEWIIDPFILLLDGDEVETKNCSRQHFTRADVGRNKAEVLAERYSFGFEQQIFYYPHLFENEDTFLDIAYYLTGTDNQKNLQRVVSRGNNRNASAEEIEQKKIAESIFTNPAIIILCVDSVEARKNILDAFFRRSADLNNSLKEILNLPRGEPSGPYAYNTQSPVFVIDSGNEDIFGQVSFFRLDHGATMMAGDLAELFGNTDEDIIKNVRSEDRRKSSSYSRFIMNSIAEAGSRVESIFRQVTSNSHRNVEYSGRKTGLISHIYGMYHYFSSHLLPDRSSATDEIPFLFFPDRHYRMLEEGEGTESCANLDQTLAINNLMAANILSVVQNIVFAQPFTYHTIRVSLNGGYSAEFMDTPWLKSVLQGNNPNYFTYDVKTLLHNIIEADTDRNNVAVHATDAIVNSVSGVLRSIDVFPNRRELKSLIDRECEIKDGKARFGMAISNNIQGYDLFFAAVNNSGSLEVAFPGSPWQTNKGSLWERFLFNVLYYLSDEQECEKLREILPANILSSPETLEENEVIMDDYDYPEDPFDEGDEGTMAEGP